MLKLSNAPISPGQTLADLIVQMSGSSYPYGSYPYGTVNGSQTQSEWQRHLSILLTLDGKGYYGFPCPSPCPIAVSNPPANQGQGLLGALGALGGNVTSSSYVTSSSFVTSSIASYSSSINLVPLAGRPFTAYNAGVPLLFPHLPVTLLGSHCRL